MNKEQIKNCKYYKGEGVCPYPAGGKAIWWSIEFYGVNAGDKIDGGLSQTMIKFIKERIWQSDSGWTTTWREALERAKELYAIGKWNAGYISDKYADIAIAT